MCTHSYEWILFPSNAFLLQKQWWLACKILIVSFAYIWMNCQLSYSVHFLPPLPNKKQTFVVLILVHHAFGDKCSFNAIPNLDAKYFGAVCYSVCLLTRWILSCSEFWLINFSLFVRNLISNYCSVVQLRVMMVGGLGKIYLEFQ